MGPYEILAPIGAGGMGEVYRARDTRLERTVAVKVLPAHLSSSAESRQRFEREAKTISQLSHPHICALYDVGREGDVEYLVMEYLEGETLSDRLGRGTLPLEQALRFGAEISDALDKAHRQGIVHRDLKPGNVMLTKSGVKLLDFGLAKAMTPATQPSGLTSLPTMAGAANLTQAGTILGTFQYMAPEQLEGKEADARSDIFALGAVLYEMVTGRKAFSGTSQASLISAIMKEEPAPISAAQPMSPPALDRLVRTCLAKDPEDRRQSAHDVGNELKWIAEGSQAGVPTKVSARRRSRERTAWALAALATAGAAVLAAGYVRRAPRPAPLVRASLVMPEKTFVGSVALSPDGRRVALTFSDMAGRRSLWVRDLASDSAQALAAPDGAAFPFWSPDSRSIAFFADGKLRRVDSSGGGLLTICDAENGIGGTWNRDGTIVFAPSPTGALFRVDAAGGKPVAVTKLDASRHEVAHRYPYFLPDGRHFFYTTTSLGGPGGDASNAVRVASLDGKEDRPLLAVLSNAQYASGRVLYVRDGALVAQRLDLAKLVTEADPVVLAPRVTGTGEWGGLYSFSAAEGVLVLAPPPLVRSRLTWFDRSGRSAGSVGEPDFFFTYRLSPDEKRLVADVYNLSRGKVEVRILDLATGAGVKQIAGLFNNFQPVWSADGSRIFFASNRRSETSPGLFVQGVDGSREEVFLETPDNVAPWDWTRDGRFLAIQKVPLQGQRNNELWILDASDLQHAIPIATEAPYQTDARFSADGKWIAYHSNVTGVFEVYVRPFPGPGGTWKVSSAGGFMPQWRNDGRELYYQSPDNKIMSVPMTLGPAFHAGAPAALFEIQPSLNGTGFQASGDGQRFLVNIVSDQPGSPPLNLLLNWTALLEKK